MSTAHIKDIKKDVLQATGEPFLDVEVEILNENEEVVDTQKHAFSIATSQEEIVSAIEKMVALYGDEAEQKKASKVADELNAQADETIDALKGADVTVA